MTAATAFPDWPPPRPEPRLRPILVWKIPHWVMSSADARWCWSCQHCPTGEGALQDAATAYDAGIAHLGSELHATASAARAGGLTDAAA